MIAPGSSRQLLSPLRKARVLAGLSIVSVLTFYSVFGDAYLRPVLREWGIDGRSNFVLAAFIEVLATLPIAALAERAVAGAYSRTRLPPPAVFATLHTAPLVGLVVLMHHAGDSFPVLGLPAAGLVVTVFVWSSMFRMVRRYRHAHLQRPIQLDDLNDADHLISECRRALEDPSLSEDERGAVELNLAGALVSASLGNRANGLPEAYQLVERSLNSGRPETTFHSAGLLVAAMSARATRSGDLEGYEDAVQLLMDAAEDASSVRPDAPGEALGARAVALLILSALADGDGDDERAAQLHSAAVADLERALEMSPSGSSLEAQHTITLVSIRFDVDLDAAIKTCRWALRRLRFVGQPWQRWEGYLVLADLLSLRAEHEPDGGLGGFMTSLWPTHPTKGPLGSVWPQRATHDLLRAAWLCMRVRGELAPLARSRVPDITHRLRTGELSHAPWRPRTIGRMYQQVFDEQSRITTSSAIAQAESWSKWAAEQQNVPELAQAHWCWIQAAVAESRRRVFQAQKERQLSQVQGLAAQAGAALLAAGRGRDAVVALELGRAVLVTERMHREREGLEERLLRAGRGDLSERWRVVCERVSQMDRGAYETSPNGRGASTSHARGRAFETAFTSAEYVTHAEHEQLLREIGGVRGFEDVDASPTYDDLRAAACDGPVVYLSVTEQGGRAIIVTDAPDPVAVELASLRISDVSEHASRLLRAQHPHDIADEVAEQLPWLWDVLVRPLVAHLPPASLVTLIPVGALSQLPIHAAGAVPDHDGVWCDQTGGIVFRYAPNARVLLRAQAAARGLSVEDLRLVTVAVADGPGERHLPRVVDESRGVAAQFTARRTTRPSPATVTNVVTALDGSAIWHFACHGRHDPDKPLDSYLLLADGPLTLRAIFARPAARGRLAVLSACQAAISDRTLLDEVISFPSALLQNGTSGVVSTQTAVDDEAAMLLVLRFFSRFRLGIMPPQALAEAQAWLRRATNAEIHDAFPEAYPVPAQCAGEALSAWRERQSFTEPHNWAAFTYSGH